MANPLFLGQETFIGNYIIHSIYRLEGPTALIIVIELLASAEVWIRGPDLRASFPFLGCI